MTCERVIASEPTNQPHNRSKEWTWIRFAVLTAIPSGGEQMWHLPNYSVEFRYLDLSNSGPNREVSLSLIAHAFDADSPGPEVIAEGA